MTVLVTGGTGNIGRRLVPLLRSRDVPVVVASRTAGTDPALTRQVDLRTGAGLPEALDGVRTVVLLHSDPRRAAQVDDRGTARVATAAKAAGVEHLVLLSIVGCDRVPLGLYRAKVAAEDAVAASGTGWTVQRSTQFHTFAATLGRALGRGPLGVAPRGWSVQPADDDAVAARLAEIVAGPALGRASDVAGPQRLSLADVVRQVRRPRWLTQPLVPGALSRALREGGNLPGEGAHVTGPSFAEWRTRQEVPA